jgi:CPA2 family monovalent cation:H+ antiporter-2
VPFEKKYVIDKEEVWRRMHTLVGLQEITLIITGALGCGLILESFRQPAILGYILAGLFLGPSMLGIIQNYEMIQLLADLGVLMVLFVVGMSLNLSSFKRILGIAIGAAFCQIGIGLLAGFTLGYFLNWNVPFTLLISFVLAISSTAVAVKVLENKNELNSDVGRLTLGILVAQDLAIVPMILILKDINKSINWGGLGLKLLAAFSILSLFVWFLSRQRKVHLFFNFSSERPELPSLVALSFCFGFAALSGFMQLSSAYGAFLAGLILGNSRERAVMLQVIMPIYSVLVMAFFLSVGLLINLRFIWENVWLLLLLLVSLLIFKSFMNIAILRLLRQPWPVTFLSGVILSQMGEFAFLLISIGMDLQIVNTYYQQLLTTLVVLSLAMSPLWLIMSVKLRLYHNRHADFWQTLRLYSRTLTGTPEKIRDYWRKKRYK